MLMNHPQHQNTYNNKMEANLVSCLPTTVLANPFESASSVMSKVRDCNDA